MRLPVVCRVLVRIGASVGEAVDREAVVAARNPLGNDCDSDVEACLTRVRAALIKALAVIGLQGNLDKVSH